MSNCCGAKKDCCAGAREVSTTLSFRDVLGAWKCRWDFGRMDYKVEPGLYSVGSPAPESPVLVSANYKMTFDVLRKNLSGVNCWLLILDTKGVNVWCAAGKGTFGTEELVRRIEATGLAKMVAHRRLILPQLGASGVSSHEVARRTGFSVMFGPVRATDIKAFFAAGNKATKDMRTVKFPMWDRFVLTPIEVVMAAKKTLPIFGALFLINLFAARPFGARDVAAYFGAVFAGAVLTPVLLPFVPGKMFAWKGWVLGMLWTFFAVWQLGWLATERWMAAGYLMLLPAVSAYIAMNFTGCSTYTSPSGVMKEMKTALLPIIILAALGMATVLAEKFSG